LVLLSLGMTTLGLFLFSFLIGMGTSIVAEMLEASNQRPLGLRGHSLLLNAGEHCAFFFDQAVLYYQKMLRRPRWLAAGKAKAHPDITTDPAYRRILYRQALPYLPDDLSRLDTASARRIVIMADMDVDAPDFDTLSAVLSCRRENRRAQMFVEIQDDKHAEAVLQAGGVQKTVVIPTDQLIALALANLMINPHLYPVMENLFTVKGSELYAYLVESAPYIEQGWWSGSSQDWEKLVYHAYHTRRAILLGVVGPAGSTPLVDFDFAPDEGGPDPAQIRGLISVCGNVDSLRSCVSDWMSGKLSGGPLPPPMPTPLLEADRRGLRGGEILICGFQSRTPLIIEQLLCLSPGSSITLMVLDDQTAELATTELLRFGRSLKRFGNPEIYDPGPRGTFELVDGVFTYHPSEDAPPTPGQVTLLVADYSSRSTLLNTERLGRDL
ncbi:MAG: hypothetical protein KC561_19405, partial [Myxococcales bacterium]|nr:hypothetical protein [Myxococcales bacterium]